MTTLSLMQTRAKLLGHELIVYCRACPKKWIIEGIAMVFREERAKLSNRKID